MTSTSAPLRVDRLTFSFGRIEDAIFSDVSFAIPAGAIHGLFGNNGSGKTTLFNVLSGFCPPSRGNIEYYGERPTRHEPQLVARIGGRLARTFQVPVLVDGLSLEQNLLLAHRGPGERFLALLRPAPDEPMTPVDRILDDFALDHVRHQPLGELSYGTRRLATVMVALLTGARLVLLDEPFANLDAVAIDRVMKALSCEAAGGRSFLLIDHQPQHVLRVVQVLHFLDRTLVSCGDAVTMRGEIERFVSARR